MVTRCVNAGCNMITAPRMRPQWLPLSPLMIQPFLPPFIPLLIRPKCHQLHPPWVGVLISMSFNHAVLMTVVRSLWISNTKFGTNQQERRLMYLSLSRRKRVALQSMSIVLAVVVILEPIWAGGRVSILMETWNMVVHRVSSNNMRRIQMYGAILHY